MRESRLKAMVEELQSLKDYDTLDEKTLNVVLWIVDDYLKSEESYDRAVRLKERQKELLIEMMRGDEELGLYDNEEGKQ